MILDSLLVGTMLFTSFAMRTPNVQPNPDDYEFSIGVDNPHFYFKRDWERELGGKYIDDLIWVKIEDGVYFKPEYMNKESQNVKYLKMDWRRSWVGATWGFTTRSTNDDLSLYETFASVGMSKEKKFGKWTIKATFDGYLPPDENGDTDLKNFEFEDKFKVSWKLTDKIRIYNLGEISKLQGKEFYKGKIGVEISL